MKSFFIIQHEISRTINDKYLVQDPDVKSKILEATNIQGLNVENFDFYDDSEFEKESKFAEMYHDSIFELYFPRVKQGNSYVYYPKPKIIETKDSTVYVNRWNKVDVSNVDIQSISYISDDSDKEEHQRVMVIFKNNIEQMENKECEQAE